VEVEDRVVLPVHLLALDPGVPELASVAARRRPVLFFEEGVNGLVSDGAGHE
jgi:hypothetical protein